MLRLISAVVFISFLLGAWFFFEEVFKSDDLFKYKIREVSTTDRNLLNKKEILPVISSNNKVVEPVTSSSRSSIKDIKKKYKQTFEQLEEITNRKLNNLLDEAYAEYNKKREDSDITSYFSIFTKFKKEADELEKATDDSFYSLYEQLKRELKSNGYSADHATEFKQIYEKSKKQRKQKILGEIFS